MKFLDLFEDPVDTYLSYGHTIGSEAWVLRGDDIQREKIREEYGEPTMPFVHTAWKWSQSIGGRIDHKQKVITIASPVGNEDRVAYARRILEMDFPGYRIRPFQHTASGSNLR